MIALSNRYRHRREGGQAAPPYNRWNGIHSFHVACGFSLTFRPRQLRYTSVGPWLYALHGVVDVGLHLGMFSIGVSYKRPPKRPPPMRAANLTLAARRSK